MRRRLSRQTSARQMLQPEYKRSSMQLTTLKPLPGVMTLFLGGTAGCSGCEERSCRLPLCTSHVPVLIDIFVHFFKKETFCLSMEKSDNCMGPNQKGPVEFLTKRISAWQGLNNGLTLWLFQRRPWRALSLEVRQISETKSKNQMKSHAPADVTNVPKQMTQGYLCTASMGFFFVVFRVRSGLADFPSALRTCPC